MKRKMIEVHFYFSC